MLDTVCSMLDKLGKNILFLFHPVSPPAMRAARLSQRQISEWHKSNGFHPKWTKVRAGRQRPVSSITG